MNEAIVKYSQIKKRAPLKIYPVIKGIITELDRCLIIKHDRTNKTITLPTWAAEAKGI